MSEERRRAGTTYQIDVFGVAIAVPEGRTSFRSCYDVSAGRLHRDGRTRLPVIFLLALLLDLETAPGQLRPTRSDGSSRGDALLHGLERVLLGRGRGHASGGRRPSDQPPPSSLQESRAGAKVGKLCDAIESCVRMSLPARGPFDKTQAGVQSFTVLRAVPAPRKSARQEAGAAKDLGDNGRIRTCADEVHTLTIPRKVAGAPFNHSSTLSSLDRRRFCALYGLILAPVSAKDGTSTPPDEQVTQAVPTPYRSGRSDACAPAVILLGPHFERPQHRAGQQKPVPLEIRASDPVR